MARFVVSSSESSQSFPSPGPAPTPRLDHKSFPQPHQAVTSEGEPLDGTVVVCARGSSFESGQFVSSNCWCPSHRPLACPVATACQLVTHLSGQSRNMRHEILSSVQNHAKQRTLEHDKTADIVSKDASRNLGNARNQQKQSTLEHDKTADAVSKDASRNPGCAPKQRKQSTVDHDKTADAVSKDASRIPANVRNQQKQSALESDQPAGAVSKKMRYNFPQPKEIKELISANQTRARSPRCVTRPATAPPL